MRNPWLDIPLGDYEGHMPQYIEEARARHASRLPTLDLRCADVQSSTLQFGPVDLIYAALIFEYVHIASALAALKRNCRPGGTLAALLQLPAPGLDAVSPSPYKSLSVLGPAIHLVSRYDLCSAAAAVGFTAGDSRTIELGSGKRFWLQTFNNPDPMNK